MEFFPLHKETHNLGALQDYIRKLGPPTCLVSDNAKSEIGVAWTTIPRKYMVKTRTSEPHHPHQNPAEPEWGRLGNMIKTTSSNWIMQLGRPVLLSNQQSHVPTLSQVPYTHGCLYWPHA